MRNVWSYGLALAFLIGSVPLSRKLCGQTFSLTYSNEDFTGQILDGNNGILNLNPHYDTTSVCRVIGVGTNISYITAVNGDTNNQARATAKAISGQGLTAITGGSEGIEGVTMLLTNGFGNTTSNFLAEYVDDISGGWTTDPAPLLVEGGTLGASLGGVQERVNSELSAGLSDIQIIASGSGAAGVSGTGFDPIYDAFSAFPITNAVGMAGESAHTVIGTQFYGDFRTNFGKRITYLIFTVLYPLAILGNCIAIGKWYAAPETGNNPQGSSVAGTSLPILGFVSKSVAQSIGISTVIGVALGTTLQVLGSSTSIIGGVMAIADAATVGTMIGGSPYASTGMATAGVGFLQGYMDLTFCYGAVQNILIVCITQWAMAWVYIKSAEAVAAGL